MDLIHSAGADTELVIQLDAHYDLQSAGLLLDTYGNEGPISDEEYDRREVENARRVELFEASYRRTLAEIGQERGLTIYLGAASEVTSTPTGERGEDAGGDTLERQVWQEAHDRTPAEPLWAETVQA